MISDTLFDAAQEIRGYMTDPVFAPMYAVVAPRLDALLSEMDSIRRDLEAVPSDCQHADLAPVPQIDGGIIFAWREHAKAPLRFKLAPGEEVEPGDVITIDQQTGQVRKWVPGVDTVKAFTVPPGSKMTEDGILEMPE